MVLISTQYQPPIETSNNNPSPSPFLSPNNLDEVHEKNTSVQNSQDLVKSNETNVPGYVEGGLVEFKHTSIKSDIKTEDNAEKIKSESITTESNLNVKDKGGTELTKQSNDNLADPNIDGKTPAKSSVVPRKGAPELVPVINDLSGSQIRNDTKKVTINTDKTTGDRSSTNATMNHIDIKKKPESASDVTEDDSDGSSGKDYVLTGVAIFICIWAIIFGALFFYKRAGELWDRRHYRRMDFLVEGMYND